MIYTTPDTLRYIISTSDVQNEVLEFSPQDWEESSIQIKRDFADFVGNKREFSLPLQFVKRAKQVLKREFFKNGVSGKASIVIEIANTSTNQYEPMYQGTIDFYKTDLDRDFLELNFLDNDIQSSKEAYQNTEFEFPFTDEQSMEDYDVMLPPMQMVENSSYFMVNQGDFMAPNWSAWGLLLGTSLQENNVRLGAVTFSEQARNRRGSNNTSPDTFIESNNKLVEIFKIGLNVNINLDINYSCKNYISGNTICGFAINLHEVWRDEYDGNIYYTTLNLFNAVNEHGSGEFNDIHRVITKTYETTRDNSNIYITIDPVKDRRTPDNEGSFFLINNATLSFKYNDFTTGEARAVSKTPFNVFQLLFRAMTKNPDLVVKSDFLKSKGNLLLTCGDAIRRVENSLLKTSFSNFYKSMSAVFDIGFDIINGIPTIEEKSYFLNQNLLIADVGEASNLRISLATDLLFNDIKTGYNKEDYNTELGKQEINNGQTWITPINTAKKTLDIVSDYRADMYGVNDIREKQFYNPNRNDTEMDEDSDDDIYMIWCTSLPYMPPQEIIDWSSGSPITTYKRQGLYPLTTEGLFVSGVEPNPYIFNFMLSPKRNLLRHARTISSAMYGEVNKNGVLSMSKADKWKNFTILYETIFYEDSNIFINNLADPYFLPFLVTFEVAFPRNFYFDYIKNPTGYIQLNYNNKDLKVFIKEIDFNVVDRSQFEITGVICADQIIEDFEP